MMVRRRVELSAEFPYHITARSNNKDWFSIPLSKAFAIYANKLSQTIENYKIECHAFVLMANHFHMMISTPEANLSTAMRYFMTETSKAIAYASNRINRIYGARYHWTLIRTSEHYAHAYYYIYRNPLKHGAVEKLEDYPWSTLSTCHRKFRSLITSKRDGFDEFIPVNNRDLLKLLDEPWSPNYVEDVSKALKRHIFQFPLDPNTGRRPRYRTALHPK